MTPQERAKRQKLDAILARHDATEQRTLADLSAAGFNFKTIDAARTYRTTLAAVDRFNRDYDADALASAIQPETARRTA